jgi:hypothetical protein
LITAHLDTHEEELENLFKNLDRKDPHRLFRQLDPDRYYPTFGVGSTTISDVDTQGRFYGRIDWRKSRAMWGNFATGVTGTEYAHFNRSLYGGLLEFHSPAATSFGESRVTAIGFASEPNSALAHNEFLGTGGSLYYLRHTAVVEGSEKVWVEVRDRDSGRITESITLERGRDYEFDDLQGRLILSRPLLQVADEAAPAIIKDTPLDGNAVVLIVDYEYVPTGFDGDALTAGGRGEAWVEDHVKIGGTIIDEERDGQDYRMVGADVTLRGGAGTYLKGEYAKSEATQADTDVFSSDGGLSFQPVRITLPGVVDPDDLDGEAVSIEGRLDLADLGAGRGRPTLAGWWKHRDDDFSTAGLANGVEAEDYGAEIQWSPWQRLSVAGRYSMLDRVNLSEDERVTGQARLRVGSRVTVGGELRSLSVTPEGAASTDALLGGVEVGVDVASGVNVYARGQGELDADDSYEDNQLATLGVRARVGEKLTARAEGSAGDRGESALVGADYNRDLTHHLYGTYTLSSDRIDGDRGIATFGQRKSISNQVDLFSENQFTHGDRQSGIAHVYGLSYSPKREWILGTTYQQSSLDTDDADSVDRRAVSATIGYRRPKALVSLRGELRQDDGPVDQRHLSAFFCCPNKKLSVCCPFPVRKLLK